jgi:hypothetical protein
LAHAVGLVGLDRGLRVAGLAVELGQRFKHTLAGGAKCASQRVNRQGL